jgi:hypothetical protein
MEPVDGRCDRRHRRTQDRCGQCHFAAVGSRTCGLRAAKSGSGAQPKWPAPLVVMAPEWTCLPASYLQAPRRVIKKSESSSSAENGAKCRYARRGTPSSLSPPVRSDEGGAAEPEAAAPHAKRPGVFRGTGRPRLLAGGRTPSASLRTTRAGPPRDPAARWPRSSESSCAAPGRLCGFATGSPALPGGVAAPVPASGQRERAVASGSALTATLTGRMG